MNDIFEKNKSYHSLAGRIQRLEEELQIYMEKYDLDPTLNWTRDSTHGPIIKDYISRIAKLEDELREQSNYLDRKRNELNDPVLLNRLKKPHLVPPKDLRNGIDKNGYVYPEIEGMIMDKTMKKRYRKRMRVLMKTMNYEEANKRVIESIVNSAVIKAHQEVKKAQLAETMKSINKHSKEDSTPLKKFSRKKN